MTTELTDKGHMIGREAELCQIRDMLGGVRTSGSALLVHGDAGIGKSTLLNAAAEAAATRDLRILRCTGTRTESQLAFAGLHEFLHPVRDRIDGLPPLQASALRAALGLDDHFSHDPFLVGLGALGLLEEVAHERPLLLVVEDLQWLDHSSVEVLRFVARRLALSPIVLLAACRSGGAEPIPELAVPRLHLSGLATDDAGRLLDRLGLPPTGPLRGHILAEAQGNPLALVELPKALHDQGLLDMSSLRPRLPLTERLQEVFATRVSATPPRTRQMLLLAAANDGSSLTELLLAAAIRGLGVEDLAPAEQEGLVLCADDTIAFRHPLVQSAVYTTATLAERMAAHRTLADVLSDDLTRSVWHRAAATAGRDEQVAAALQAVAESASARGGTRTAVHAFERAARLSPSSERRARRLTLAVEAAQQAGLTSAMHGFIDEARSLTDDPVLTARLLFAEAIEAMTRGTSTVDLSELVTVARRVASSDPTLAAYLVGCAVAECYQSASPPAVRREVAAAIDALGHPPDHPVRVVNLSMLQPREHLAMAPAIAALVEQAPPDVLLLMGLANAAEALQMLPTAEAAWHEVVAVSRRAGAAGQLTIALNRVARGHVIAGRLRAAKVVLEEASRLALESDVTFQGGISAVLHAEVWAIRGDVERAAASLDRAKQLLGITVPAFIRAEIRRAEGLAALAGGRHREAFDAFAELATPGSPSADGITEMWAVADLAEAAVRANMAGAARELIAAVSPDPGVYDSSYLRIRFHRADALLAVDGDAATASFERALAEPGLAEWPLEEARTRLVYGEWLRRHRRVSAGRAELQRALELFESQCAATWAQHARAELRGAGVGARRRADEGLVRLTPQEYQIAQLAAAGLSNRDIADQMFLSHRTVASHLYKVFPKLGVTTRGQLRDALDKAITD
ncbi:LuxR family transcriptional regulator [Sphaerisporangium krabiense]|nr:LuxR family transcriptional regulator [Sphaerisporangium krabiense]